KTVARLDQTSRAACLALFGPVPGITEAQYGQIVDLVNDDAGSFTRELTEALTKEPRALSLAPERQEQLLAWVRENTKESSQWPDIKKQIAKWLDTPVDKRPQAAPINEDNRTDSGATLGDGNKTDRSPDLVHNLSTLRIEVAVAILSMYDEIDIYWIPNRFMMAAKGMAEAAQDPQFTAWWAQLRGTPGILDYSRAAIIALIKSAPEDLWLNPIKLREYINRELVESNHAKPDQK
ncbi:exodeoxyribonuclease VIII, partial [Enterobacter hormaechei subsp. steigerwaltii]